MQAEDASVPIQPAPSGQTLPLPGAPTEPAAGVRRRGIGAAKLAWLRPLGHNRKAVAGAAILLGFAAIALLAPVIAQYEPREIVARRHLAPSSEHWFGTTGAGQDVFSQTVWGAR